MSSIDVAAMNGGTARCAGADKSRLSSGGGRDREACITELFSLGFVTGCVLCWDLGWVGA